MPLAYIHLMNGLFPLDNFPNYPRNAIETFDSISKHLVIANGGFDKESGEAELEKGIVRIISYGTLFLANPDLPRHFGLDAELNQPYQATIYGAGEQGYTHYPFLKD